MSYAAQQRDPSRHLTGIVFVVALHIVIAYALVNGLARKVVEVIKNPLEVKLIAEIKPPEPEPLPEPPPPPPPPEPPKRKLVAKPRPAPPPPAYVPPPEVAVAEPAPAPTISVTQAEPPPPAPPAPPAPAAPPAPVAAAIGVACPNHLAIRASVPYPPQALRLNKSGEVLVEFIVGDDGAIENVRVARSSDPIFDKVATSAVQRFKCIGQGRPVRVSVPFQFAIDS